LSPKIFGLPWKLNFLNGNIAASILLVNFSKVEVVEKTFLGLEKRKGQVYEMLAFFLLNVT